MCRQVAKLAGALSVLTRHSSSRKTMSMSLAQPEQKAIIDVREAEPCTLAAEVIHEYLEGRERQAGLGLVEAGQLCGCLSGIDFGPLSGVLTATKDH
jgi:hypothetical protein